MRAIIKRAAGLALVASLAAPGAAPGTSSADTPGTSSTPGWRYWERCGAPSPRVTRLEHHDAACRVARRVASRFSLDNPSPKGFRCNSRDRGRYSVVTCAKSPGIAVQVIRFRLTARPAHPCAEDDRRSRSGSQRSR